MQWTNGGQFWVQSSLGFKVSCALLIDLNGQVQHPRVYLPRCCSFFTCLSDEKSKFEQNQALFIGKNLVTIGVSGFGSKISVIQFTDLQWNYNSITTKMYQS